MTKNIKSVFLVILNWNNYKDTIECLDSVSKLKTNKFELQIVVVDNNSSDNSVEYISSIISKISNLQIIQNNKNLGYAGGNNIGIKHALKKGADFVFILNNDTTVDEDLVNELVIFSKNKNNFGIISPKIYFAKGYEFHKDKYKKSELGEVIWSAGGEMDWDNVFGKNTGVDEVDKGQFDKSRKIDFATGAAMFINTNALEEAGVFDERYFMYFEDADLITRFNKKGYENYYDPNAVVWHKVAQSSGIGSDLNDYFISRNRLLFGMQYAPLRTKVNLMDQSFRHLLKGRNWQKKGVLDFYLGKYGKGSWVNETGD